MKKDPIYGSFRERLLIDFEDIDIDSKKELSFLMQRGGYRVRKSKISGDFYNAFPSEAQIEKAWEILKGVGDVQLRIELFITETYKGVTHFRANRNQIIEGKIYRKGQFIPKRKK